MPPYSDIHCKIHSIHSYFMFGKLAANSYKFAYVYIWAVVALMDRALDLKPEVVGSNPGSGRKCPRLR